MVEKLERYIDAVSTTSLVPAESIRCPNGHGPACVTAVELTNNLRMRHEDDFDPKITHSLITHSLNRISLFVPMLVADPPEKSVSDVACEPPEKSVRVSHEFAHTHAVCATDRPRSPFRLGAPPRTSSQALASLAAGYYPGV